MTTHSLGLVLARGALGSPFKRPRPGATFAGCGEPTVTPGLRVDLDRLARYERVCGFPTGSPTGSPTDSPTGSPTGSPTNLPTGSPTGSPTCEDSLPVTYPHVLGFPSAMGIMSRGDFPLPLLGLVHTSIEITRHRALPAAGTYELAVRVDRLAPHRHGTQAHAVTELREDGTLVWESTSTYLARHRTPTPTAPDAKEPEPAPLPVLDQWQLGADVGRRYAAASGDRNPIHLHPLTARLFGFPRAIAHGMWTVARCLAAQGTPPAVHVRADFRAPVLLPGTVTFGTGGDRFELRQAERLNVSGQVEPLGD